MSLCHTLDDWIRRDAIPFSVDAPESLNAAIDAMVASLSEAVEILGFGEAHTRAHFYRAILEGLAYGLRAGREQIERKTGLPLKRVVVAGGGSQSDTAMQITADVFGLPAERPAVYETSALGAAINLAVGLGMHPDYPTAVAAMTRIGARFTPDASARKTYERLYREVYQPLYPRLQPLYQRIREITGYPP